MRGILVAMVCAVGMGGCLDDTSCTPSIDCSAAEGSTLTDSNPTEPGIQTEVTCAVACIDVGSIITLRIEELWSALVRDYSQPYDGSGSVTFPFEYVPGSYTGHVFHEGGSAEDTFNFNIVNEYTVDCDRLVRELTHESISGSLSAGYPCSSWSISANLTGMMAGDTIEIQQRYGPDCDMASASLLPGWYDLLDHTQDVDVLISADCGVGCVDVQQAVEGHLHIESWGGSDAPTSGQRLTGELWRARFEDWPPHTCIDYWRFETVME